MTATEAGYRRAVRLFEPGRELADPLDPYVRPKRLPEPGRPWVLANMVSGLDGGVAVDGRVGALSSVADRQLFSDLRSVADMVLVGAETVRREHYGPIRLDRSRREWRVSEGRPAVPSLVVLSASLDLDPAAPGFVGAEPASRTIVLTGASAPPDRLDELSEVADVHVIGGDSVDLGRALALLRDLGAETVLTEGGPTLLGELVAAGLLDELCLTMSPLMGADPLPIALVPGSRDVLDRFSLEHVLEEEDSLFLRYVRL